MAGELASSTVDPRLSGVEGSNGTRLRWDTSVGVATPASGLCPACSTSSPAAAAAAEAGAPSPPPPPRVGAPPGRDGRRRADEAATRPAPALPAALLLRRWRARLSSGMSSGAGRRPWLRQLLALPTAPPAPAAPAEPAGAVAGLPLALLAARALAAAVGPARRDTAPPGPETATEEPTRSFFAPPSPPASTRWACIGGGRGCPTPVYAVLCVLCCCGSPPHSLCEACSRRLIFGFELASREVFLSMQARDRSSGRRRT